MKKTLSSENRYKQMLKEREGVAGISKSFFGGRIPQDLKYVLEGIIEDLKDVVIKVEDLNTAHIQVAQEQTEIKTEIRNLKEKLDDIKKDMINYTDKRVNDVANIVHGNKIHEEEKNLTEKQLHILLASVIASIVLSVISILLRFLP